MNTTPTHSTLSAFFIEDHRNCDSGWAEVEKVLDQGDLEAGAAAFTTFELGLLRHFRMEEEVIFPAFEAASGNMGCGPTTVMRQEHQQLMGLLQQIRATLHAGKAQAALDLGDTLLMVLQQHNVKEEGILYPACDHLLAEQWPQLKQGLKEF